MKKFFSQICIYPTLINPILDNLCKNKSTVRKNPILDITLLCSLSPYNMLYPRTPKAYKNPILDIIRKCIHMSSYPHICQTKINPILDNLCKDRSIICKNPILDITYIHSKTYHLVLGIISEGAPLNRCTIPLPKIIFPINQYTIHFYAYHIHK